MDVTYAALCLFSLVFIVSLIVQSVRLIFADADLALLQKVVFGKKPSMLHSMYVLNKNFLFSPMIKLVLIRAVALQCLSSFSINNYILLNKMSVTLLNCPVSY